MLLYQNSRAVCSQQPDVIHWIILNLGDLLLQASLPQVHSKAIFFQEGWADDLMTSPDHFSDGWKKLLWLEVHGEEGVDHRNTFLAIHILSFCRRHFLFLWMGFHDFPPTILWFSIYTQSCVDSPQAIISEVTQTVLQHRTYRLAGNRKSLVVLL